MVTEHSCAFPEVEILEADEDDALKAGMKVLAPCPICGDTPADHFKFMEERDNELQAALLAVDPGIQPWYHWTHSSRRKQILRYGLRPNMRPTTSTGGGWKSPYICLGDSPSWAWALSGDMRWTPRGEWDLWMVWSDKIKEPVVHATPNRPSGVYELRTEYRIYKRNLWYVGSRVK